jgi:hypothetical protein
MAGFVADEKRDQVCNILSRRGRRLLLVAAAIEDASWSRWLRAQNNRSRYNAGANCVSPNALRPKRRRDVLGHADQSPF